VWITCICHTTSMLRYGVRITQWRGLHGYAKGTPMECLLHNGQARRLAATRSSEAFGLSGMGFLRDFAQRHALETADHDVFAQAGVVFLNVVTHGLVGVFDERLI
jgi:hypothetical protein